MKRRGRPPKRVKQNIIGLRNQSDSVSVSPSPAASDQEGREIIPELVLESDGLQVIFDSVRVSWEQEDDAWDQSDIDEETELDRMADEELARKLADMAEEADAADGEWLPPQLRQPVKTAKERPHEYVTGLAPIGLQSATLS
ncbi:hypothetical protein PLEOSDRAFT_1107899 [Pleurotus ostreatus PC15]|uniref:Uncharacterized protein n=1 Tax=Pleurotus ostreatus (strain PC15) TaxID=1137138 RepID=A0A067NAW1_PLEO1|nr:hypothetical protein PLEOSDRAFT_1107899 [Pleurotus ostreatus PC15]